VTNNQEKVIVTGAAGFIGRFVLLGLRREGKFSPRAAVRDRASLGGLEVHDIHMMGNFDSGTNWSSVLEGGKVVVHCAARAHVPQGDFGNSLAAFREANRDICLNFAKQAANEGIERFIFISSIGVNGNINTRPFTEDDEPNPTEPYAQSKWEAEQGLWEIQRETGMELVIIRPPLVYGANAPGNFGSLVHWVEKGVPLPLGAIHNKRSLVALDNLVDLIITCIDHPAAANQVFLAGDGQDVSTTELLHGVGRAMGKPARLIPVPAGMLMFGAGLLGKKAVAQRLLGSLQVDISKARNLLGWEPPLSVEEGLRRCFVSENEC